MSLCEYSILGS